MEAKLISEIAQKICSHFKIDKRKAEQYAKDLIKQTELHGGNPENSEQMDKSIQVVVKKWIEKGY